MNMKLESGREDSKELQYQSYNTSSMSDEIIIRKVFKKPHLLYKLFWETLILTVSITAF